MKKNDMQAFTDSKHRGMTLRDYFASKNMMGILSNSDLLAKLGDNDKDKADSLVAETAYRLADAMLKARTQ